MLASAPACLFSAMLAAHEHGHELSFLEPLPVVLSASRMPTPLRETPGSVTVIDEALIRATGYRDLARLFRLVPGMQVGQERGHRHWVTYHGLGIEYPNQMQVLVDGRSVHSPDGYSGADWTALPVALADIERIEVVRGPNSAAYGSNAFLGVINIITRHTRAETGSSVSTHAGPDGLFDATGRVVIDNGAMGLRLTAQHERDEGFRGLDDSRQITRANLRGDLRLGQADELTVHTGISHGRRGEGYPDTLFNIEGLRTNRHHNGFIDVQWRHSQSATQEFVLAYAHNRERYREAWFGEGDFLGQFLRVPASNNRDTRRDDVHLEHHFAPSDTLRALWGAEWRRDRMAGPFLFHARGAHSRDERRLFGSLEWRAADAWLWNAGAMVERIADDDWRFAPRLALNWLAAPAHTWRAGYSRAYRYPSLFERHADVQFHHPSTGALLATRHIPNPDIRPQRIDSLELGYLGDLSAGRGLFDIRLFHERIVDLVRRQETAAPAIEVPPQIPEASRAAYIETLRQIQAALGTSRWDNLADPVRLSGLEYQLRFRPWRDGELILNQALIDARASDRQVERTVAPHVASLTWLQRGTAWEASLTVLHMARVDLGSGFVPEYRDRVPSYTTVDASMAWQIPTGAQPVTLRLSGINLLGRHQEVANRALQRLADTKPTNEVGRQLHVSLLIPL